MSAIQAVFQAARAAPNRIEAEKVIAAQIDGVRDELRAAATDGGETRIYTSNPATAATPHQIAAMWKSNVRMAHCLEGRPGVASVEEVIATAIPVIVADAFRERAKESK